MKKGILPYLLILAGFGLGLVVLFFIFDKIIMPAVVSGSEIVEAPDVAGLKLEKAEKAIEDADLKTEVSVYKYSLEFGENEVMSQIPPGGVKVKTGRHIYLTVSKGKETVDTPYLLGKETHTARYLLSRKGLTLGSAEYEFNDSLPAGRIVRQNPKFGAETPYGSSINVVVSKGPETTTIVPNLLMTSFKDAETVLKDHMLILGEVEFVEDETYLPSTIITQSPPPGEIVLPQTPVNLSVTKEK